MGLQDLLHRYFTIEEDVGFGLGLKTHEVDDEPQLSYQRSTLVTYLMNPPTSSFPNLVTRVYIMRKVIWWILGTQICIWDDFGQCWAVIRNMNKPLMVSMVVLRFHNHDSQIIK
jgi:hypothetical protein